jgi:CRISPR/Cas system CSM-associated protein Csm3 (group 7 of RAMP superfamily)
LEGVHPANSGLDYLGQLQSSVSTKKKDRYDVTVKWSPVSRIMVKSGREGTKTKIMPLVSGVGDGLLPVIPGSSIKGALRSQACRILRTIFGQEPDDDESYLAIADDMFGSGEQSGRLFVNDVYLRGTAPLSRTEWIDEDEAALNRITKNEVHVAIDRFTGGASEGALYSVRPVVAGGASEWEPIRIVLDFSTRSSVPPLASRLAEQALLKLLIRDLSEGFIPLGFGTNRGFGDISVANTEGLPGVNKKNTDGAVVGNQEEKEENEIRAAWEVFVNSGGKFVPTGGSNDGN